MWLNDGAKFDQMKNVPKIWSFWFLIGSTGTNEVKCVSMPWRGLNIRTPFLKEKVKTFAGTMWKTSRTRRFMILLLSRDFSVVANSTLKSTPGGYPVWESAQIPCNARSSCRIRFWISNLSYTCRYLSCFMNYYHLIQHSLTWHVDLEYHLTRDCFNMKLINVVMVRTAYRHANSFFQNLLNLFW